MPAMSEEVFTSEDEAKLKELSTLLCQRGLAAPAIAFLEMYRPLTTLIHTGGVVIAPLLAPLLGYARCEEILRMLKDRRAINMLISFIEFESAKKKCKA